MKDPDHEHKYAGIRPGHRKCTAVIILACLLLASPDMAGSRKQLSLDPKYTAFRIQQLSPEMRHEIGALQYVLKPSELQELLDLPTDYARRRWIDEYWKLRDPVFTTEKNELLEEHRQRVAFAESAFFVPKWPMWDQRGEIYIRYGPPAFRRKISPEIEFREGTPPGEIWYYKQYDMYILFEYSRYSGRYTYYLSRVRGPHSTLMRNINKRIDELSESEPSAPAIAMQSKGDKFMKKIYKLYEVIGAVPSSYSYDFKTRQLPFAFALREFRGNEKLNRIDVNIEFFASFGTGTRGRKANNYIATAVLWDSDHREVGRKEQKLTIPAIEGVPDSTRLMPAQIVFSVAPGFYSVAVTLEEEGTGRISSFKTDVTCHDLKSRLAMSDIILASKISPSERTSPFNRGPLEVVPHPMRRYRLSSPVPLYFEVYNLKVGNNGLSSYSVEYRVVSKKKKPSFWSALFGKRPLLDIASSFEGSSMGSNETINLNLGTNNLWAGEFELIIKVRDNLSHRNVSKEVDFSIVE